MIKAEEKKLDPARSYNGIHSYPGGFSITMATSKKEPYGRCEKKRHKLLVDTGVLSINEDSE